MLVRAVALKDEIIDELELACEARINGDYLYLRGEEDLKAFTFIKLQVE